MPAGVDCVNGVTDEVLESDLLVLDVKALLQGG